MEYSGLLVATMDFISNYGCWCRFDSYPLRGSGTPQSEVDNLCKQLHEQYHCLEMEDCIPWETNYDANTCYHDQSLSQDTVLA